MRPGGILIKSCLMSSVTASRWRHKPAMCQLSTNRAQVLDRRPGLFHELTQARFRPFQRRPMVPQFGEEVRPQGRRHRPEEVRQLRAVER